MSNPTGSLVHQAKLDSSLKKSVSKDLQPIPNKDVARILQCMEQLQENPRPVGSEKLSGQEPTGLDRVLMHASSMGNQNARLRDECRNRVLGFSEPTEKRDIDRYLNQSSNRFIALR